MWQALVLALQKAGMDVVTAAIANRTGYIDEEQLAWVTERGRVLYSANIGDFCRIHRVLMAECQSHAGIVLAQQQRYSIGELVRGMQLLTAEKSAEDMVNQLVFLNAYIEKS